MERAFYQDILVVVILTIISVLILLLPALNLLPLTQPITYIPYILLLLFLPGYSLLAAENPLFLQNSMPKKLGLSLLVSLVISILLALLLTFIPLKISNIMIYIIAVFTLILSLSALLKRRNYHFVHYIEPEEQETPLEVRDTDDELVIEKVTEKDDELIIEKVMEKDEQKTSKDDQPELEKDQIPDIDKPAQNVLTRPVRKIETPIPVVSDFKTEKVDVKIDKTSSPDSLKTTPKTGKDLSDNTSPDDGNIKSDEITAKSGKTSPTNGKKKPDKITPKPRSKRGFAYYDLIIVLVLNLTALFSFLFPIFENSILEGVLRSLLMLILPGYALVAVLYPGWKDLDWLKRLAFSFGISYFLTALIGLVLNYTPLGNSLKNVLLILSLLTLIFLALAFISRRSLSEGSRFRLDYSHKGTGLPGGFRSFMGVAIIIIAVLFVAYPTYNLVTPAKEVTAQPYTEFFVVGADGNNITNYPTNLTSGETGTVSIVLVNHEQKNTTYHIMTTSNGTVMDEINVTLQPDEKKVIPYNFTAGTPGTKMLEFRLFKMPNLNNVYLTYSFWININGALEETVTEESTTDTTATDTTYIPDNTDTDEPVDDNITG